jgi:FKBP-type peptidyl-prolyl cis-trans isomerase
MSCNQNELPDSFEGYTKFENGIHYKFLHKAGGSDLPQEGDVCIFHSSIYRDSELLSSTYDLGSTAERIIDNDDSGFPAQKILPKMAVGDSLSMAVLADSLSMIPPDFAPGEWMNVVLRLVEIKTLADRQNEKQEILAKMERHPKGFFWTKHKTGRGASSNPGDEVTFSFTLRKDDKIRYKTENGINDKIIIPSDANTQTPLHTSIQELKVGDSVTISFEVERMPIDMKDAVAADGFFSGDLMTMDVAVYSIRDSAIVAKEYEIAIKKEQEEMVRLLKEGDKNEAKLQKTIEQVKAKKIDLEGTESGLLYVIHEKGDGHTKHEGEGISMNYIGSLYNGSKKFDSSYERGRPLKFEVGENSGMINGMNEIAGLLSKGAKATVFIPSHLAYGEAGSGDIIPPNAMLVFYIDVLN